MFHITRISSPKSFPLYKPTSNAWFHLSPLVHGSGNRHQKNREDLCTHFMYGFVFVQAGGANGGYMLKSNDPNADHPSGHEAQDGLCPEVCLLAKKSQELMEIPGVDGNPRS